MTEIGVGSLLTDGWQLMKGVLYSELSDIGGSRPGSEFVVSAWPNRVNYSRSKWLGYPFVVLTADIESQRNLTTSKGLKEKTISFTAEVYDKSQQNVDTMTNQINEALDVSESGIEGSGFHNYRVESMSTSDMTDPGDALVHVKSIRWMYDYIAQR